MYRHYFYCSMSFRCIIIQDAQSYSENSGTGGTLWRNPNELSQNTEVIICQHTSRYCFCPVIIGRFPIFPAEAFIFITVWRLGSVIPTAVRWRSTEKNRLSMPEMSPFFPAMFHIPLTVHQARKATGLIFSWIRRNCSAISSPPPGKITTCPRTVSQHSVIFSAKRLFPTSTIWYLIHELEEQNPCYQISARSLLCSLYIELYRIESLGGVNPDTAKPDSLEILALQERKKEGEIAENSLVISPALEYIEKNYMQQFSIEYLADLCHWSPTHFRRVFHDIMGTSPLDYVNNTRILKSCILLRSTEHSILDISEMVGFHSVSSFNRYFIKLMQMSPREYRKQMQQSEKKAENQSILEFAGWMRPE